MLNILEREGAGIFRLARACLHKEKKLKSRRGGEKPSTWEKSTINTLHKARCRLRCQHMIAFSCGVPIHIYFRPFFFLNMYSVIVHLNAIATTCSVHARDVPEIIRLHCTSETRGVTWCHSGGEQLSKDLRTVDKSPTTNVAGKPHLSPSSEKRNLKKVEHEKYYFHV
jgi:hypothetical protein